MDPLLRQLQASELGLSVGDFCCVMPVLMYGSESWILTEDLIRKLERFQGELANVA